MGTSTGIIMVKKWGDFASCQRGGYGANGGVPGHDSRRRATTTKEDVNDEVRCNRGACVEGWVEIWLVRAMEEALIVAGRPILTVLRGQRSLDGCALNQKSASPRPAPG